MDWMCCAQICWAKFWIPTYVRRGVCSDMVINTLNKPVHSTKPQAHQIHVEAKKFSKPYNLVVAAVYGGMNKHEQFRTLKGGCEIAVCTPGRLIGLLLCFSLCVLVCYVFRFCVFGFSPNLALQRLHFTLDTYVCASIAALPITEYVP